MRKRPTRERKHLKDKTRCGNVVCSRKQPTNPINLKDGVKDWKTTCMTEPEPNNSKPKHSRRPLKKSRITSEENIPKDTMCGYPSRR